jgi:hypothetical protein
MPTFNNNPALSSFIVVLKRGPGFPVQDVIPFQFMPDNVRDAKVAVYNDIAIVARSSPIKNYSHSGPRTINFTLQFFAAPEAGLRIIDPIIIKTRVDALRALVVPNYEGFVIQPPPRCIVHLGMQMAFLGVCKSVNVSYSGASPWGVLPMPILAHHATVDLSFEEALNIPLSYNETRMGLPISLSGNEFAGNIPIPSVSSISSATGIQSNFIDPGFGGAVTSVGIL